MPTATSNSLTCAARFPKDAVLRPSLTVSDLKIDYTPETSAAVDSLYMQQLDIRIFADEFFRAAIPADSL